MKYFINAPVPEEIAEQHTRLVEAIRANPKKNEHTKDMVEATLSMADNLFHYFFMRPMDLFNGSSITKTAIGMGIKTGLGITGKIAKKAFAKMDEKQLLLYADYVEGLISTEE